jgi:hypothetical protein
MKAADRGGAFTRERWLHLVATAASWDIKIQWLCHWAMIYLPASWTGLHSRAGRLATFSLWSSGACPIKVRGAPWGSREITGTSFPSGHTQSWGKSILTLGLGFPAWNKAGCDFHTPIWHNPQILSLQVANSTLPRVQSTIQWGAGMGAESPPSSAPGRRGVCDPWGG